MTVWVVFEEYWDTKYIMNIYSQEHQAKECVDFGNDHLPSGCLRYYYSPYVIEDADAVGRPY